MLQRIQRRRTKGWRMPRNTVYVGRPTQWGNRCRVVPAGGKWYVQCGEVEISSHLHRHWAQDQAVNCFKDRLDQMSPSELEDYLAPLRGKNLCCWCAPGEPCHAGVLLDLANRVPE